MTGGSQCPSQRQEPLSQPHGSPRAAPAPCAKGQPAPGVSREALGVMPQNGGTAQGAGLAVGCREELFRSA